MNNIIYDFNAVYIFIIWSRKKTVISQIMKALDH